MRASSRRCSQLALTRLPAPSPASGRREINPTVFLLFDVRVETRHAFFLREFLLVSVQRSQIYVSKKIQKLFVSDYGSVRFSRNLDPAAQRQRNFHAAVLPVQDSHIRLPRSPRSQDPSNPPKPPVTQPSSDPSRLAFPTRNFLDRPEVAS